MKTYKQIISEAATQVSELFPWDVEAIENPDLILLDIRDIVLICRSGYRSVLAAFTMQLMGYLNVHSLKTGLRG